MKAVERSGLTQPPQRSVGIWTFDRAGALGIFIAVLIAYTIQTELAQAVQRTYQKPYLLLYLAHSAYIFIFPIHLFLLHSFDRSTPLAEHLAQLREIIILQFSLDSHLGPAISLAAPDPRQAFPYGWLLRRSIQLAGLIAVPSLCWYTAVAFADMTSVTAIYNTNACFAYLLAVRYLDLEAFNLKRTAGVVGSFVGVLLVSLGGASEETDGSYKKTGSMRLLGTGLALLGSISYAAYEVWYKKVIALPEPQELDNMLCRGLLGQRERDLEEDVGDETEVVDESSLFFPQVTGARISKMDQASQMVSRAVTTDQNKLLHANLMTTMIGVMTVLVGSLPIPILDWFGIEKFEGIDDPTVWLLIFGMILMGVVCNGGFMVLLGLWGPVVASVGNLCTLVLIAIVDRTAIGKINAGNEPVQGLSITVLSGCLMIMAGFSAVIL